MKDAFIYEGSETEPTDFAETTTTTESTTKTIDPIVAERHRNVKCGLINTAISVGINSIPIIIDSVKNKKQGIPNKINKTDIVRLAVTAAFPILETVDAAFLGNKLTEKCHLKDARNVVNLAMTYPAAHRALNDFMNKTAKKGDPNASQVPEEKTDAAAKTWLGIANLITPYVTNKFTDSNLTFMQKINSTIPIPMVGGLVRRFARNNPAINNLYETGTGLIRFASGSAKSLTNAVRAKPNSTINKATTTVSTVADTLGDLLGVPRGNVGYGNFGGYNNYGGSAWGRTTW